MAWIRSQDGKYLIDAKEIWLHPSEKTEIRALSTDWAENYGVILGSFQTAEAAMEEIDSIHRFISNGARGAYQIKRITFRSKEQEK